MKKTAKGFLGPIGDDLPSLIPLLFALMMFFYVFTFTWNAFDERGRAFNDALSALRVGNTLKGNNYLRGIGAFQERCNEAQALKRIKFMAGLLPLSINPPGSPGEKFEGINIETLESEFFDLGGTFICTNTDERPEEISTDLIIRSFPIALEFKNDETKAFYVRPMLLVVVTWR